jgi:hypothetical protein
LERLCPGGEASEHRIVPPGRRELDVEPADLRCRREPDGRAGRPREHLGAEADADEGDVLREHVPQESLLALEPRM